MTDMKMDEIERTVAELDQIDHNWRDTVKSNDENNISDIEKFHEYMAELLFEIRKHIKNGNFEIENHLNDYIHDNILCANLMEQAEKLLIHYHAMEPLRILERNNLQLCLSFFRDIMDNYVRRLDTSCLERFEEYKFKSSEEMQKAIESLDMLSDYYVGNSFSRKTIKEDFGEETGLSENLCEYYAELVDKCYQDIKMNLILRKVELLEKKFEELQ